MKIRMKGKVSNDTGWSWRGSARKALGPGGLSPEPLRQRGPYEEEHSQEVEGRGCPPSSVLIRLHLGTVPSSRRMSINQSDKLLPKEGSK